MHRFVILYIVMNSFISALFKVLSDVFRCELGFSKMFSAKDRVRQFLL